MKQYIGYMNRCIELAKQAQGNTSPNPLAGCVILNGQGKIIAQGYHKCCGQNHAERDALLKLSDAQGCVLVVNLEPCSHFGKTPPCVDLIIEKGIKKVVYGMKDPNPVVCGHGLKKLQDAGIEVIGPVLEDECKKLNEVFIKNHTKKQVFAALKTASTIDGKIAASGGDSKWITSESARAEVKNIRRIYDAILTSSATILADNPVMEHKIKIILDRELKTDLNADIYKQGRIYIFCSQDRKAPQGNERIRFIRTPVKNSKLDIEFILGKLFELGIMSVLIEAGGLLNGSFLPYVDKLYHFTAPKILCDNTGKSCFDGNKALSIADCTDFKFENFALFPPDVLLTYIRI